MSISGVSNINDSYNRNDSINSLVGSLSGTGTKQLAQAAAVAEEGFQQTMQARRITNTYAAAKEVR